VTTQSSAQQWHRNVRADLRLPTLLGIATLLLCIGGFAVWAGLAPLEGAVVVSGSFVATGQNKFVQHLEGGILRETLVKEGDLVEEGQPLLRLDATAANARLRRLVLRKYRLFLMKARLEAEIDGQAELRMPETLKAEADDAEVQSIFERQTRELRARKLKQSTEVEVLRKEIAGLNESIRGYTSQAQATSERRALFAEELKDKQGLFARQLARKTEVFAMLRAEAGLSGELGELTARVADANERIARAEQQIAQVRSAAMQKAIEELRTTETELDDVQEQARAALDVVERMEVRSPVRGVVVKLHQHTQGGVIAAGAVILELLPVNDELIIEARLNPSDIWHVKTGQRALVKLSALNQRITPMIEGKVLYLSADAVTTQLDATAKSEREASARPSYVVRVRLDERDLRHQAENFRPTPGMPADVFIKTGERTFFDYIMRPVRDSLSKAFREQ
jgi:HlyD family type I secretion membrane fusion protein